MQNWKGEFNFTNLQLMVIWCSRKKENQFNEFKMINDLKSRSDITRSEIEFEMRGNYSRKFTHLKKQNYYILMKEIIP